MDDGDQAVTRTVEQRLGDLRGLVDQAGADVARQLAEHGQILSQRVDAIDMKMVDRAMAMEERINEHNGVKMANLEATIGRVGVRLRRCHGRAVEADRRSRGTSCWKPATAWTAWQKDIAKVDEEAINAVKEQLSSAVGEAMLVRIEVDRFIAAQDEKFDATSLRLAEIESQLADTMDVSEAVQLERLEEIERALTRAQPQSIRPQGRGEQRRADSSESEQHPNAAGGQRRTHHRNPASRRTDGAGYAPLAGDGHYGTVPEDKGFTRGCSRRCRGPQAPAAEPGEAAAECMRVGQLLVEREQLGAENLATRTVGRQRRPAAIRRHRARTFRRRSR